MVNEFKFPDVGEGITEGEIVKWHVKEGDTVKEHDVVVDVETDKSVANIPSPYSGKVLKIYHKEGDTVKVGEVIITIGSENDKAPASPKTNAPIKALEKPASKKPQKGVGVVGELPEAEDTPQIPLAPIKAIASVTSSESVMATPAVRRLARDLGVDISKVKATGAAGRITEEDIRNNQSKKSAPVQSKAKKVRKYDFYGYVDRLPLKGIRKATAKHMVESAFSAPHVTHTDDADVTDLWKLREKEKLKAEKKGVHLTFLPFVVKAVIAALKEFPNMNATLDEEHEEIIVKKYFNIGIAVDTGEGLLVPVIKEAQDKSILEIAKEITKYAKKAKDKKLDLGDMKGNSFTITNIGVLGGRYATPIINTPDVAIMATGQIKDEVKVVGIKTKKMAIRKILPISVSFDHRVVDGAYAAKFTSSVIQNLEDPEFLLMQD